MSTEKKKVMAIVLVALAVFLAAVLAFRIYERPIQMDQIVDGDSFTLMHVYTGNNDTEDRIDSYDADQARDALLSCAVRRSLLPNGGSYQGTSDMIELYGRDSEGPVFFVLKPDSAFCYRDSDRRIAIVDAAALYEQIARLSMAKNEPSESVKPAQSDGASPAAEVVLTPLPEDMEAEPLQLNDTLPPLELPEEIPMPELRALTYRAADPGGTMMPQRAEAAAEALWGTYTREGRDGLTVFASEIRDTDQGKYQETIFLSSDTDLNYQAKWLDTEEAPFHQRERVNRETALELARTLAGAFGLDEMTGTEPAEPASTQSADYCFVWPITLDGLSVEHYGLTVRVIGDTAVTLRLAMPELVPAADETSEAYFLSAEQAVYCMNYARGQVDADSVLHETPVLRSVRLIWTEIVDGPSYSPAYAFDFSNESGTDSRTFYVDAYTGEIVTGTNEGNYPSPYPLG